MNVSRVLIAAALVVSASAFSTVATAQQQPVRPDCGWIMENGRMVFLGTCPHDSSDDSNPPPEQEPET